MLCIPQGCETAHMLCSVKCSLIHMALTAQSSVYFELQAMNIRSLVYMIPNLYTFTQYTNLIHAPDMIIHKITELSGVHDIYTCVKYKHFSDRMQQNIHIHKQR